MLETIQILKERQDINLFSCIIPVFNEECNLKNFLNDLAKGLSSLVKAYELIIIDDGSSDLSFEIIKDCAKTLPIKAIRFSRNFGKEYAITAGIDNAIGDVAIIMDSDGQHPVDIIPEFIQKWKEGFQVIYGIQEHGEHRSKFRGALSEYFYKILNITSSVKIPPHAGDLRMLDKVVINELKKFEERTRFFKGLFAWVGFKSIGIKFKPKKREHGHTKFSFFKLFELALNGITAFSDLPLRIWTILGAIVAFCSLSYAAFLFIQTILFEVKPAGWPTLSVALFFLSGVQLISIGVLGEYIAKIFQEVKKRPIYIVEEYLESDVFKK